MQLSVPLTALDGPAAQPPIPESLLSSSDAALSVPCWFAVRVQPQHEKTVARGLDNTGLETFLPLYRTRRMWSDRLKELDLPLFPGYVFAHLAFCRRIAVLRTPGVLCIVSFGSRPAPVSDQEITTLKGMVASGLPLQPWPYLGVGQWVRIERGPLRDIEGILIQVKGAWRVVVSINLLRRSVAAEVDRSAVWPLRKTPQPR